MWTSSGNGRLSLLSSGSCGEEEVTEFSGSVADPGKRTRANIRMASKRLSSGIGGGIGSACLEIRFLSFSFLF